MFKKSLYQSAYAVAVLLVTAGHADAADGWKVRFPLSGSLGGEIAAKQLTPGLYGSVVATQIEVDKVTGDDGNALTLTQAHAFSRAVTSPPSPIAMTVSSSYSGAATVAVKQSSTVSNVVLGYLTETEYAGGRLNMKVNIPYISLNRTFSVSGATPTLAPLSSSVPGAQAAAVAAGLQPTVQGQFALGYQAPLAAYSAAVSGTAAGVGDIEVTGAWVQEKEYADGCWRNSGHAYRKVRQEQSAQRWLWQLLRILEIVTGDSGRIPKSVTIDQNGRSR